MEYILIVITLLYGKFQEPAEPVESEIIGVYQGTTLFIQNPYRPQEKEFCIRSVYVNGRLQELNYNLSAIKLDFERNDLYTPVTIKIVSKDSLCNPIIINPDAILFHTSYKFTSVSLTDTALYWAVEGEREAGIYTVEKLENAIWVDKTTIPAKGEFVSDEYIYYPDLEEGGNKYRVRYDFGNGKYIYSDEADFDYYPEPVSFSPKKSSRFLTLSRSSSYKIYDSNSKMVLSGRGTRIDIRKLWPGDYVIYFEGNDPGVFTKVR